MALWAAIALGFVAVGARLWPDRFADPGKCDDFVPVSGVPLIAHAGGGLPSATYTNSREAMDLAVAHGFELIEIDFFLEGGDLKVGHDRERGSTLPLPEFIAWVSDHPGISIVTDMKDGNAAALPLLAAHGMHDRFIVQIYDPSEYDAVKALGYERQIFTAYRLPREDWQDEVNRLDLFAVTVPASRQYLADGVRHPVFLHTVNEPYGEGVGLYTDCLIPA